MYADHVLLPNGRLVKVELILNPKYVVAAATTEAGLFAAAGEYPSPSPANPARLTFTLTNQTGPDADTNGHVRHEYSGEEASRVWEEILRALAVQRERDASR